MSLVLPCCWGHSVPKSSASLPWQGALLQCRPTLCPSSGCSRCRQMQSLIFALVQDLVAAVKIFSHTNFNKRGGLAKRKLLSLDLSMERNITKEMEGLLKKHEKKIGMAWEELAFGQQNLLKIPPGFPFFMAWKQIDLRFVRFVLFVFLWRRWFWLSPLIQSTQKEN